ncbi:MAG: hypothetical protein ACK4MM_00700 [Fervidobacterium sp.]
MKKKQDELGISFSSMIGASNFFELSVAVAVLFFGIVPEEV